MKFFLLKAAFSVGLLAFLVSRIELAQLLTALSSAHLFYLGLMLLAYLASQVVSCGRWVLLARPLGFRLPFRNFLAFYFIGMFFNLFAPSTIGGDIGRVFYLAREQRQEGGGSASSATASALVSVVADRAIGLAALVWVGAGALGLFPAYALPAVIPYVTFALALGAGLGWFLLPWLGRWLGWIRVLPLSNLSALLDVYCKNQRVILAALGLSLLVHFIQSGMQILLGLALGLQIPWSYSFILYPLVGLFSSLPISFNGIGLREVGYLFLLNQIEISAEKAIAFGLLWFAMVALESLVGGVVFVVAKGRRARGDSAT